MPATKMHARNVRPTSALKEYRAKRDFRATPEPGSGKGRAHRQPIFVIQKHAATRLHYDVRLEAGGVLKSWAVTNEPTLDPAVKRLAVRVEDHPLAYADFAGDIPKGHYGAGHVEIWDRGTYELAEPDKTVGEGLDAGKLSIVLHGDRLKGRFALVRMRGKGGKKENWLLIKSRDEQGTPSANGRSRHGASRQTKGGAAQPPLARGTPTRLIKVTHPDKVLFPDSGITKAEVVAFYRKVAKRLIPFLKDRPVTLERLPDGLGPGKPHFWQKNTPETYPDWIPRLKQVTERGRPVEYVLVNDMPTLLYLVNQGTLTFHPWLSRVDELNVPDFVLFDLDPCSAAFANVVAVAKKMREILEDEGRQPFLKTSGKSGLHILVPWNRDGDFEAARSWAVGVAERVAKAVPKLATTEIRKVKRGDRVYVDVMQNARGHHAVPPYVIRAVPEASVSTPLHWRELTDDLDPTRFNIRSVPNRIARQARDPFTAFNGQLSAVSRKHSAR